MVPMRAHGKYLGTSTWKWDKESPRWPVAGMTRHPRWDMPGGDTLRACTFFPAPASGGADPACTSIELNRICHRRTGSSMEGLTGSGLSRASHVMRRILWSSITSHDGLLQQSAVTDSSPGTSLLFVNLEADARLRGFLSRCSDRCRSTPTSRHLNGNWWAVLMANNRADRPRPKLPTTPPLVLTSNYCRGAGIVHARK